MSLRLTTWNLQGRSGPDLAGVVAELRRIEPDVVVLQEVQRRQARILAAALGWESIWRFKHWPVVIPAEGLAVLTAARISGTETVRLAQPYAFWSSDRRVAIRVDIERDAVAARIVGTHLGAGVGDAERARQARLVVDLAGPNAIVAGDLNTTPGSAVIETFRAVGMRDAWAEVRDDDPGFTNWRPGPRADTPVQRLDYVMVGEGWEILDAFLPAVDAPAFEVFGALSDHLPLTVEVRSR